MIVRAQAPLRLRRKSLEENVLGRSISAAVSQVNALEQRPRLKNGLVGNTWAQAASHFRRL